MYYSDLFSATVDLHCLSEDMMPRLVVALLFYSFTLYSLLLFYSHSFPSTLFFAFHPLMLSWAYWWKHQRVSCKLGSKS